jgi:hypothetical protein
VWHSLTSLLLVAVAAVTYASLCHGQAQVLRGGFLRALLSESQFVEEGSICPVQPNDLVSPREQRAEAWGQGLGKVD